MQNDENRMILNELLSEVETVETAGDLSCEISSIEYDSRRVTPGALFVALPGEHVDGSVYIEEAAQRGASAVVTQEHCALGGSFPCVQVPDARVALAKLADAFHCHPSRKLRAVGITGTNGKTTVSFMLREIFKVAGKRPGLIGTVRYEIGDRVLPAARTTPEAPDIQRMLAQMARSECDSIIMEVSSHALDQHRVEGIEFDTAVFTNLTQDHLDYHGTLEEYFEVKSRLFSQIRGQAIINCDDPWGRRLIDEVCRKDQCVGYGFNERAQVRGFNAQTDADGSRMHVESPWGEADISLQLIGRFNLSNALAAFAAAASQGISVEIITRALSGMENVPGRLESIPGRKGKCVYVDYSIITNDNPRMEIPEKIAADISAGFDSSRKYEVVLNRRAAIARGIELIGKKDILLVAGKGHETTQEFDGTIVPFDDRETVREAF